MLERVVQKELVRDNPSDEFGFFYHTFRQTDIDTRNSPGSSDEPASDDDTVDNILKDGGFITPNEYYNNKNTTEVNIASSDEEGFFDTSKGVAASAQWFWVEDLRNWCSYTVDTINEHSSTNVFNLQVWNGKNGWIKFLSDWRDYRDRKFLLDTSGDAFDICKYQYRLLDLLTNKKHNYLAKVSGSTQSLKNVAFPATLDRTNWAQYFDFCTSMQIIYGLRLQRNVNYSINEGGTFQTIRWSSLPYIGTSTEFGRFASTNARFAVTTGVPPVWRLPTGEIFLATCFIWRGDNGRPYCYIKDGNLGFRKHYDPALFAHSDGHVSTVAENKIMGTDNLKAEQWINNICARFFGNGLEKTIEKDWLRTDDELISKTIESFYAQNTYINMLDSAKTFEQNNINKQNTLACRFTVNRPVVTTEERKTGDYALKW